MDIKKGKNLYTIFLQYLVSFCVLSIMLIFLLIGIFGIGVSANILQPANYVQNQVEKLKLEVDKGLKLSEDKIPYPSKYVFFNDKNEVVKGNINEKELRNISRYLDREDFKSKYIYTKISYEGGYCVIGYDIKAHFNSKYLNELVPYPEILLICIFFIGFIGIAFVIAIKFEKKLKKELYPLKVSTEKIMNQDLDFEILPSNVAEFNEVLISISNMKAALKKSLQAQWYSEQEKKNQICALAHDIKTPITIIKGNAELLEESELSEDDKEFAKYIISNADKIERYVSILMDISNSDIQSYSLNENVKTDELLDDLQKELFMLCSLKDIKISTSISYSTESFASNKELLMRAIINIMSNAVDYSPAKGEIEFIVSEKDYRFKFTVRDCGEGFSEKGLEYATSQFFMEASERKVGKHYGMGLYIAESVAKKHGGYVLLENRKDKAGAEVSLVIDIVTR